jgi:2-keto-4-pentenoate hydratase
MTTTAVEEAARLLSQARATGLPIAPLTLSHPELTTGDAYGVQLAVQAVRLDEGRAVRGYKVGLTSQAMQRQMGVAEPDYGYLLDDMLHSDYDRLDIGAFLQPRVEPEIAFVLRSPLSGPGVTVVDAVRAVDFVLPAIEVIDSRIQDWQIGLVDTIADNASSGAVVLGSRPAQLGKLDLRLAGVVLRRNGEVVGTGAGAAVLGSPLVALVWLANTLGRLGVTLEPGHVVLSGSCTKAVPVTASDTVSATVAGIGTVTASFSTAAEDT